MEKKATFSVILAGCLWGIINLFVKELSAAGLDSMQIAFVRIIIAAVIFSLAIFIIDRSKFRIELKDIWMFIGTGIISIVMFNTCYFYAVIHGQASVAVILLYTSPIFVMLMAAVLFKEKITGIKIIALILTFAGCVMVAGFIGGSYTITPIVLAAGIASGFLYALYSIFGRYALAKYDSLTVTLYTFIFGLAGVIPISRPVQVFSIIGTSPKLILLSLGIGIISTILPYFFYTWGLNYIESGKAAIFVAVEPLVGAVIGMTVFKESHDSVKIAGICFILAAIILLGKAESKNKR